MRAPSAHAIAVEKNNSKQRDLRRQAVALRILTFWSINSTKSVRRLCLSIVSDHTVETTTGNRMAAEQGAAAEIDRLRHSDGHHQGGATTGQGLQYGLFRGYGA